MNEDEFMEHLILSGALEVAAIDMDNNEPLYKFTDKLKDIAPELHKDMFTYFYTDVMTLWEHGFVDVDLSSDDPVVTLTDKALNLEDVSTLDKQQKSTLKEIIRILNEEL